MRLYDFQKTGVKYLLSHKKAVLADDMGLGKTVQVLKALDEYLLKAEIKNTPFSTLIVCPAITRLQWYEKYYEWCVFAEANKVQVLTKTNEAIDPDARVIITSYSLINAPYIHNQILDRQWQLLVLDECHYLKSVHANRTNNILSKSGLVHKANRVWCISGTPLTARPADLYPVLKVLAGRTLYPYAKWEAYAKRYCGAFYDPLGHLKTYGASNLDELREKLQGIMLRREYKDIYGDKVNVNIDNIPIEMSAKSKEHYDRLLYQLENDRQCEPEYKSSILFNHLAEYKAKEIKNYLKFLLTKKPKFVIFYHHYELLNKLIVKLNTNISVINGRTPMNKRQGIVKEFTKQDTGILFAQTTACATGLDGLQHNCNIAVFAEMPWTAATYHQAIGRLNRQGQGRPVFIKNLICQDTVDEKILQGIKRKKKVFDNLFN